VASRTFPHESTADQWFAPDQLHAYLLIGDALATDVADLLEEIFPAADDQGAGDGVAPRAV
jgi:hypothetical protein